MSDFQEGAVWNAVDANGETALDTAVAAGQHEAVSELIQLETYEKNVTDSENANDERLGIESGVLMDGTTSVKASKVSKLQSVIVTGTETDTCTRSQSIEGLDRNKVIPFFNTVEKNKEEKKSNCRILHEPPVS